MRMVDIDAVIKRVQELTGMNDVYMPLSFINEVAKKYIVDTVPKWIPCEDRLPKVGEEVLCQCRANIIEVLFLEESGSWENPSSFRHYLNSFVIAWMPLPKPYEERSK